MKYPKKNKNFRLQSEAPEIMILDLEMLSRKSSACCRKWKGESWFSRKSERGRPPKWTVSLYAAKLNKTITQNNDQQRIQVVAKWLNLV